MKPFDECSLVGKVNLTFHTNGSRIFDPDAGVSNARRKRDRFPKPALRRYPEELKDGFEASGRLGCFLWFGSVFGIMALGLWD